jgi:hypothetical protein
MLTNASGSATIGTTEYFLASASTTATYQTSDGKVQVFIDLSAMAAGDQYQITVYETAGGSPQPVSRSYPTGVQSTLWVSEELTLSDGWEIGVKKMQGTDRTITWSRKRMNGDAIADSILDRVYEGSRTLRGFFRVARSILINKASGLEGTTVTFRDDADTKNRVSFALSGGSGKNARVPTIDET